MKCLLNMRAGIGKGALIHADLPQHYAGLRMSNATPAFLASRKYASAIASADATCPLKMLAMNWIG